MPWGIGPEFPLPSEPQYCTPISSAHVDDRQSEVVIVNRRTQPVITLRLHTPQPLFIAACSEVGGYQEPRGGRSGKGVRPTIFLRSAILAQKSGTRAATSCLDYLGVFLTGLPPIHQSFRRHCRFQHVNRSPEFFMASPASTASLSPPLFAIEFRHDGNRGKNSSIRL